jgi:hypothetical protein
MKAVYVATAMVAAFVALPLTAARPEAGTDGAPPTAADINVRFPEPLRLRPSMNGEIRAIGAAPFRGVARLRVAGRVVARQSIRGNFSTEWSPLRVRFSVRARRRVIRIAEREHRRPVLEISISARIDGRVTLRLRRFIVT